MYTIKLKLKYILTPAALKDAANKKVAKDMFERPNKGPHYTLEIGNDQIFQTKLEKAVGEGKLKDFNFLTEKQLERYFNQLASNHHYYWCMDFHYA